MSTAEAETTTTGPGLGESSGKVRTVLFMQHAWSIVMAQKIEEASESNQEGAPHHRGSDNADDPKNHGVPDPRKMSGNPATAPATQNHGEDNLKQHKDGETKLKQTAGGVFSSLRPDFGNPGLNTPLTPAL